MSTKTLTPIEIKQTVLRVLGEIAPEVDLTAIAPNVSFREQIDVDSVDFLNFAIGLNEALGVEIPESDYARIASLDGCVAYLAEKTGAR